MSDKPHLQLVPPATEPTEVPRLLRSISRWKLTKEAFDAVLESFDADRDTATDLYITTRRDLMYYFEARGLMESGDHADEVFDRAARRLENGEQIVAMRGYLFGIARFLLLEVHRSTQRRAVLLAEHARQAELKPTDREPYDDRLAALQECLVKISPADRELVLKYYDRPSGGAFEYREKLAEERGTNIAALRVRIQRLRNKLETCVGIVMKKRQMFR